MQPIDSAMSKPLTPCERIVTSRQNSMAYRMVAASSVAPVEAQLSNLVSICNEPAIFEFLFKRRFQGRPYELADARAFLTWASQGWREQTHFVFLLVAPTGLVSGALDIKSADRNLAEVGYWASATHRGLMSVAVHELKSIAREAGFKLLFARVRKDNPASIKVLERNGFVSHGDLSGDPSRLRYEMALKV